MNDQQQSRADALTDERKLVAQLLFALTERQKGNVIRSEDEYIDSARALLAAHPGQPEPRAEVTGDTVLVPKRTQTGARNL